MAAGQHQAAYRHQAGMRSRARLQPKQQIYETMIPEIRAKANRMTRHSAQAIRTVIICRRAASCPWYNRVDRKIMLEAV